MRLKESLGAAFAILISAILFLVPFVLIILTAVKDRQESSELGFSWPTSWHIVENIREVFAARNGMLVTAFINSTILTVSSVAIMVIFVFQTAGDDISGSRMRGGWVDRSSVIIWSFANPGPISGSSSARRIRIFPEGARRSSR
jgi:ABC-type maltose transport system permease subunit